MPPKVSCPGLDPAVGCQVPGSVPCSPPLVDSHSPESQLGSNQHWRRGRARFRQPESLCFAVCLLARLLRWLADLLLLARSLCLPCLSSSSTITTTRVDHLPPHHHHRLHHHPPPPDRQYWPPRADGRQCDCQPTPSSPTFHIALHLSNRYLPKLTYLTYQHQPTDLPRFPAAQRPHSLDQLPACLPADLRLSELTAL